MLAAGCQGITLTFQFRLCVPNNLLFGWVRLHVKLKLRPLQFLLYFDKYHLTQKRGLNSDRNTHGKSTGNYIIWLRVRYIKERADVSLNEMSHLSRAGHSNMKQNIHSHRYWEHLRASRLQTYINPCISYTLP